MIELVQTHCPHCDKLVWELHPYTSVGKHTYYVCEDCKKLSLKESDLLELGYHHGYAACKDDIKTMLYKLPIPRYEKRRRDAFWELNEYLHGPQSEEKAMEIRRKIADYLFD